jgi:anhydro-N-acetylmuramic acid kinase
MPKFRVRSHPLRKSASGARLAAGLISGTSMDGVDAALVRISGSSASPHVRLAAFVTVPYPAAVRFSVLRLAAGSPAPSREFSQLNQLLGEIFAEAALRVCRRARIRPEKLFVIGSHGQTIYHQGTPSREAGRMVRSTLQIAEPAAIALRTGAPVVADFRKADIAAGGQGAPLVPMLDYLLLRSPRSGTIALNIGGIANLTVIPAGARPSDARGFDTGPGNMAIDGLVRVMTRGRTSFDREGRMARRGKLIESILERALEHPFFRKRPPKSAGREEFGREFLERYLIRSKHARPEDLVRTATELTARTIAGAIRRFVPPQARASRLVVSGGGAHNAFLMERLAALLSGLELVASDEFGLPVDAKEAIAFAVLADRTMRGFCGNLPSVTGARRAVVLGSIVRPWGAREARFRI